MIYLEFCTIILMSFCVIASEGLVQDFLKCTFGNFVATVESGTT